jgi:predicted nuclease of predicted toxin-antitoxin system
MRFKLDENLPVEVARGLRQAGHEAETAEEEGLAGASDARLAELVRQESRALMTLDVDFANLRHYPPSDYSGLIVFRLRDQSKRSVLAALSRFLARLDGDPLIGHLWIVDETTIRTHD